MAYAMKLKYANFYAADEDLINWIRDCYNLDDPETKTVRSNFPTLHRNCYFQVALEIGGSLILKMRQKQVYDGETTSESFVYNFTFRTREGSDFGYLTLPSG